jgi:hypothetical protein
VSLRNVAVSTAAETAAMVPSRINPIIVSLMVLALQAVCPAVRRTEE